MGHDEVSARVGLMVPLAAFAVRVVPYLFIAKGWVVEDGCVVYWLRSFLDGQYVYLALYPHTAIFGMSFLVWLGAPLDLAAKMWGPLMGAASTYLIYRIIKEMGYYHGALPGALLYAFLDSAIYRQSSIATSLEATAITLSFLFILLWHRGIKVSYVLLPIVAYTHFIVFFATCVYLFGWWWTHTTIPVVYRIGVAGGIGLGLIALLRFLPVGYALHQVLSTIQNVDLSKVLYLYSSSDITLFLKTLIVTGTLFLSSLNTENKHLRNVAMFYLFAVTLTLFFHSPIVSPYRLIIHMGALGVIGFASMVNNKNYRRMTLFAVVLCLISLGQVYTYGLGAHVHFHDTVTEEELDMLNWLDAYDPTVSYSLIFWDDVGLENALMAFSLVVPVDPYSTREEDYGLWGVHTNEKKELVKQNASIIKDLTPLYVKYVMYSDRFADRALFRLPEGPYNKLIYRNYVMADMWHNNPNWVLIYDEAGGKIYGRKQID